MEIKLKFFKQKISETDSEVAVQLIGDTDDIRKNWAILGMRFSKIISENFKLESLDHIEDAGAEIIFLNSDYFFEIDPDDEPYDNELTERLLNGDLSDGEKDLCLGMKLNVFDAYDRIGGLIAPSVLLARMVFSQLEEKRQRVSI